MKIIETTNYKDLKKVALKSFYGNCVNGLNDESFQNRIAFDPTDLAQMVENRKQISKQEFLNITSVHPDILQKLIEYPKNYEYYYNQDKDVAWIYNIKEDVEYFYA